MSRTTNQKTKTQRLTWEPFSDRSLQKEGTHPVVVSREARLVFRYLHVVSLHHHCCLTVLDCHDAWDSMTSTQVPFIYFGDKLLLAGLHVGLSDAADERNTYQTHLALKDLVEVMLDTFGTSETYVPSNALFTTLSLTPAKSVQMSNRIILYTLRAHCGIIP